MRFIPAHVDFGSNSVWFWATDLLSVIGYLFRLRPVDDALTGRHSFSSHNFYILFVCSCLKYASTSCVALPFTYLRVLLTLQQKYSSLSALNATINDVLHVSYKCPISLLYWVYINVHLTIPLSTLFNLDIRNQSRNILLHITCIIINT